MAERVDAARLLTYRAAEVADRTREAARELSLVKVHATQGAVDNANDALQLHGGIRYTTERHVERHQGRPPLANRRGPTEGHEYTVADIVDDRYPLG